MGPSPGHRTFPTPAPMPPGATAIPGLIIGTAADAEPKAAIAAAGEAAVGEAGEL